MSVALAALTCVVARLLVGSAAFFIVIVVAGPYTGPWVLRAIRSLVETESPSPHTHPTAARVAAILGRL